MQSEQRNRSHKAETSAFAGQPEPSASITVPIVAEEVRIDKRLVETGRTRLIKQVAEETVPVTVTLVQEETDVKRVPINRPVAVAPAVRYEGQTMIVPVLREELVVSKQLILVEEVHITKHQLEATATETVTLRHETVTLEHIPSGDSLTKDSVS